jgi:surface antigen
MQNEMLGSKPEQKNIFIKQGSDFSASFQILDAGGSVVSLSGSVFTGQIRKTKKSTTLAASFAFSVQSDIVTISLAKADSSAMVAGETINDPASKYFYDIEWTKPDGKTDRIQEGTLILSQEVTR